MKEMLMGSERRPVVAPLQSAAPRRVAAALIVLVLLMVTGKALSTYLGLAYAWIVLPFAVGVLLVQQAGIRNWALPAVLAVAFVALAAWTGNQFQDATWDGNMYHKPATVALHEGWNPWSAPEFIDWARTRDEPYYAGSIWEGNDNNKWVSHYPNLSWLFGAALMDTGFGWESGKALGMVLAIALFLYAISVLTPMLGQRRRAVVGAILLAIAPTLMAQAATNYVDGATYVAVALCVLACLDEQRGPTGNIVAWGSLIVLAGLKFTGALYGALLVLPFLFLRRPNWKEILGWALLGAFVLSHPYLNHLVSGLPIAYPVTGNNKVMENQAEPSMLEGNRAVTLARSLFAHTSNTFVHPGLKLPGEVGPGEVEAAGIPDTRYAGFGPLFSLAFCIAALAILVATIKPRERTDQPTRVLLALIGYLMLLTFVHAAPWWARYVPFLYIAVVLALLGSWRSPSLPARCLSIAGMLVLVANIGLVSQGVHRYTRQAAVESAADVDAVVNQHWRADSTLIVQAPQFVGFSAVYHFSEVMKIGRVQYQYVPLGSDNCGSDADRGYWIRLVRVCQHTP